jgi:hypothetical protein
MKYSKEREEERDLQYEITVAEREGKKDVAEYLYDKWLDRYGRIKERSKY